MKSVASRLWAGLISFDCFQVGGDLLVMSDSDPKQTLVRGPFFFSIVRLAFFAVTLQHLVRVTDKPVSLRDASAQVRLILLDLPLLLLAPFGSLLARQRWRLPLPRR